MTYVKISRNISQFYYLIQIYTLEQDKRGLCPYDDKRYLLAELPDGTPNPNTHAYGHRDLATEVNLDMDMPDQPGTDLIIEQRQPPAVPEEEAIVNQNPEQYQTSLLVLKQELRFKRRNARVAQVLSKRARRDSNGEEIGGDEYDQVPDGDENGELSGAQLRRAEQSSSCTSWSGYPSWRCNREYMRTDQSPRARLTTEADADDTTATNSTTSRYFRMNLILKFFGL